MELWDKADLDLVEPAHLVFEPDGMGAIRFIAVAGGIDYRVVDRDGRKAVEFSWEGVDEADTCCGRGWARIDGDTMKGRIFIHAGDGSSLAPSGVGPNKKHSRLPRAKRGPSLLDDLVRATPAGTPAHARAARPTNGHRSESRPASEPAFSCTPSGPRAPNAAEAG